MFPRQKIHTKLYLVLKIYIFFFTKYAGISKLDFKITTYFSNKT